MVDGNFVAQDGSVPEGQEVVKVLLDRCLRWADIVLERSVVAAGILLHHSSLTLLNSRGQIDEEFRDPYNELLDVRNQLDRLSMTHAWSLRESDLYLYQRKLNRIDESRVDGNFLGASHRPADIHAQRVS